MYRVYIIQSILKASEWPLNPTMNYNVGSIVVITEKTRVVLKFLQLTSCSLQGNW